MALDHLGPIATLASTSLTFWVVIGVAVLLALFLLASYQRCPQDHVLIVYGKVRGGRNSMVRTRNTFVWPVIQGSSLLSLAPVDIELFPSGENRPRPRVRGVARVQISPRPELIMLAAERLLGLSTDEIRQNLAHLMQERIRRMLTVSGSALNDARKLAGEFAQELAEDLERVGVELLSLSIGIGPGPGSRNAQLRVSRASRGVLAVVTM
ncbi:MAG: hypothetical protein H6811_07475 [Phycisphaeraceae bacterium]|nr:hypothetical protein [Phycisphaeraceae bacterium]